MSICKAPKGVGPCKMTCFTLLCSRVGEFTWLITISQVVQTQILKAFTLLHKSLSNYILRGLLLPGITTAFIEAVFEQTEESRFFPWTSLTTAVYYVCSSRSQTWWPSTGYSSSLPPKLFEMNKWWGQGDLLKLLSPSYSRRWQIWYST